MLQKEEKDFSVRHAQLLKAKRALLEKRLRGELASSSEAVTISRQPRQGSVPLSLAQQRLWFLDQLEPQSPAYNIPDFLRLNFPVDTKVLKQSVQALVQRHEVLRTTFVAVDAYPMQVIAPTLSVPLPVINLSNLPEMARWAEAQHLANEEAQRPFDLTQGPLLRLLLLQLGAEEYVLLLTMHHIISDGWSIGLFFQELAALYTAFVIEQPSPLPDLPIQYVDYALWQREVLQWDRLAGHLSYWKQQLAGSPAGLELPTDRPRLPVPTSRGSTYYVTLPKVLTSALKELSRQEGVTLYMTLVAAFQTLLYRYSGQDDVVIGTVSAGRTQAEAEALIGFFVNTLVLRTDLSGNPTFRELLGRVRQVIFDGDTHQEVPFESLVRELHPTRALGQNPLFQVMLTFVPPLPTLPTGWEPSKIAAQTGTAKFDLSLELADRPEGLVCYFEYSTDLFDAATIARMAGHWQTLLEGIVAEPTHCLVELPLLTETERQQMLVEWNDTASDYPRNQCLHQLFEAQVERLPEAVAVVFEGEQVSYWELNRRANQLAHHLQRLGVGPDALVGICVERSLEMVVGLLGILKAGGAYVPLDPTYPAERIAFMMTDARPHVLLTQQRLLADLPEHEAHIICLDTGWSTIAQQSGANPTSAVSSENLAYVIYTSGSTGQPKGVMVSHRAICNHMFWMQARFPLAATDRVLQKTPFSFDASMTEFYAPLLSGAQLIMARPGGQKDSEYLIKTMAEQRVTILQLVPSLLRVLLEDREIERCRSLRRVFCAGEELPLDLQSLFFNHLDADLINLYGPTEASIDVTFWPCERESVRPGVPIGRPIANTQIYLLDAHLRPVPVGVPGELYIGGAGLARGYLNRPELTSERFIRHPFSGEPAARLYKTGDLARYLPDGPIEFLGRVDQQVKIRGFRIEPGEIETVLELHPAVQQAVVVAREHASGDKRLVAYIVAIHGQTPSIKNLRSFLKEKLPEYMLPSAFMLLDALPLTPNGKVDRRALPAPGPAKSAIEDTFVAPTLSVHYQLLQIWEELFDIRPIGIRDNFFDLGGHSFLAARLVSRIEQVFRKKISLAILFAGPTIEHLADALQQQEEEAPGSWSPLVAIQTSGSSRPFFFLHGDYFNGAFYCFPLARNLGPEQPFYALEPYRFDVLEDPPTLGAMAAAHLESLRSIQSEGPYLLGGFCNGGLVAYEMARQLHAQGETVDLLVLIDPTLVSHRRPMRRAFDRFGKLMRLHQDEQLYWFLWLRHMYRYLQHIYRYLRFPRYRRSKTEMDGKRADQNGMVILTLKELYDIWLNQDTERSENDEQIEPGHRGNGVGFTLPRLNDLFPEALFPPVEALRKDWAGIFTWVISEYEPGFYPGKSTFFFAEDSREHGHNVDWHKIAQVKDKEVEVHFIAGTHTTCKTRYLHDLTERLRMCLSKAQVAQTS